MKNKLKTTEAARVTIFRFYMFGYSRHEFSQCSWEIMPYAQHKASVHIVGFPRMARIAREIRQTYLPGIVILDGWGHTFARANSNGFVSASDFDGWLENYVRQTGANVLADFRKHDVQ